MHSQSQDDGLPPLGSQRLNIQSPTGYRYHFANHLSGQRQCGWDSCSKTLQSTSQLRRHLHQFHRVTDRVEAFRAQYCYDCAQWFKCEFEWEDRCQWHLRNLSVDCGMLRRDLTMVTALKCPFCLGDTSTDPSKRFRQWTNRGSFHIHIEFMHFKNLNRSLVINCPHPLCRSSSESWMNHLSETHGIVERGACAS